MRRDIRRHTDCDTGCTIHKEIRKSGRKDGRFLLRLIKVRREINGIFIDIRCHFHGDLTQARLGVTHGRGPVPVYGPEVSVPVYERIPGGPLLGQIDQGAVDRAVAMRMVFTHCITDDTRTFTVRFVRPVVQLDHRVEDPSLHRL